jgi:phage major head subunit gpT-like protein
MISRLSDVNDWYMTIKGQAEMPFVLQMRKRPEFAMPNFLKGGKGSAYQFEEDGWLYGALMRLNVGYGWPQTIIKNKNP